MTFLTTVCWALPVLFVSLSFVGTIRPVMLGTTLFLVFLYISVWVWWRPGHFSLGEGELRLHFPLRSIAVPLAQIEDCELWESADLKSRYGNTYRVGAGGLWGGFGWLRSSSKEWIEFYISRQSGYVHIRRPGMNALLITPERAPEFVAELRALLNAG